MARKKQTTEMGDQMDLIDVAPENAKEIMEHAKRYNAAMKRRIKALAEETAEKQKILSLVKDAHLQRLDDGKIKFRCDGYTITVTPRDELVKVKEDSEDED